MLLTFSQSFPYMNLSKINDLKIDFKELIKTLFFYIITPYSTYPPRGGMTLTPARIVSNESKLGNPYIF